MIVVKLEQDKQADSILRVKSWQFVPKEKSLSIKNIPGDTVKIDNENIPTGFYEDPTSFFLDGNKLRKYYVKEVK